jgi:membrane-associated phospholipid phosphatase
MTIFVLAASFSDRLWSWLSQVDTWLFLQINTVWTSSFLDGVYPWWREANAWVPLYLFLVVFGVMNFGKKVWPWLLFAVITLTFTDQISSNLIKNLVTRTRPCNETLLAGQMRLLLNHCSGGYSFTSSHATNHFGFAMFIVITMRHVLGRWRWLFLAWAATISYGQVYVGVHYPLDVLCGSLLGCMIGYCTGSFFTKKFGFIHIPVAQTSP